MSYHWPNVLRTNPSVCWSIYIELTYEDKDKPI